MCWILGIYNTKHQVVWELYDGLTQLQHRWQDAAWMVTFNGKFYLKKWLWLVKDVFHQDDVEYMRGRIWLWHTRYSTNGNAHDLTNAQPLIMNTPYGISMVHNGNLTNYEYLKTHLAEQHMFHSNTQTDLETLMWLLASKMYESCPLADHFFSCLIEWVRHVLEKAVWWYSTIGIIADKWLFAFRDPHGIRPLVRGKRENKDGSIDYIFASENTMFYGLWFEQDGDVMPGELVYIDMEWTMHSQIISQKEFTPDIFEYIYFARPDAHINDISVYRARLRMGANLAQRWKEQYPDILPDVVIPVPFSANTSGLSMAKELGVRYSEGIYKNPFVGRTFIMSDQKLRKRGVKQKLSPQRTEIKDKKVMLLDDSIVRWTTSKQIVEVVRHFGAKEVYFVSACPPVKYPDFYGIDIPSRSELIAYEKTNEEIREYIGADMLLYQTIEDVEEAVLRKWKYAIQRCSKPYLDGFYITGDVTEEKMNEIDQLRTGQRWWCARLWSHPEKI